MRFCFRIRARKTERLNDPEKGATLKNNMRGALRIDTAMVGLAFGLVPLHHERRSLLRIRGACFLALLLVAFAAFPCFGQQSPDPTCRGAASSTPPSRACTP